MAVIVAALMLSTRGGAGPVGTNGESQKDVEAIVSDSAFAFSKAQSFHLTGHGSSAEETDVYDLHVSTAGTQGRITADGAILDVVAIGDDAYLHGQQFFTTFAGQDAGDLIGDHWVHVKTDDPKFGQYLQVITLSGLQHVISQLAVDNPLAKGGSTRVDGAVVMALRGLDGELDVALDGKPYPRRLHFTDGDTSADLHFGEFDTPQPPPQKPDNILGQSQQLSL